MAEKKHSKKSPPARKRATTRKAAAPSAATPALSSASGALLKLGSLKPSPGSRPKRQRIGRGHGSGMVKTGGEGGKGQTARSGGGKGPAFEGGQTPWARRLPHRRGYSQKARDIGHFRARVAVVNLHRLAQWDPSVDVTPESLQEKGLLKRVLDGVKILAGSRAANALPTGLRFRDVMFSEAARSALVAAGAQIEEGN
ncbi:MAG: 50S ribosomal protein L15 [Candidatus Eremiobacteraeota bacterium]|nr:50S ribosomal protein L15 [Candidatus Eremiobacteraeota bacterium]